VRGVSTCECGPSAEPAASRSAPTLKMGGYARPCAPDAADTRGNMTGRRWREHSAVPTTELHALCTRRSQQYSVCEQAPPSFPLHLSCCFAAALSCHCGLSLSASPAVRFWRPQVGAQCSGGGRRSSSHRCSARTRITYLHTVHSRYLMPPRWLRNAHEWRHIRVATGRLKAEHERRFRVPREQHAHSTDSS
jgi:hypothetical protein